MRFGRGNLRRGNLIVETLIYPYFSRLPHSEEVVTSLSAVGGNLWGIHTWSLRKYLHYYKISSNRGYKKSILYVYLQ